MAERDVVERLIAEAQARSIPQLTPRRVRLVGLRGKVDVVVGMRRSGKTYFVFQQMRELVEQGIPRERLLYLDFEDERLLPFQATELQLIPDVFYERYPKNREQTCWFYFDEVHNVPGWERFIRRLLDTENVQVVLTGSSARLLAREIATSLRGRSLATEIFPFDFEEALRHAGLAVPARWPPGAQERSELQNRFRGYLEIGGFPEVQSIPEELRGRVLRDYVDVVLFRDVVERHGVTNVVALRYLVRTLLRSPAGKFSVHRFHNDLKSQEIRVGKDSLHEYLGHLEDAFLVYAVKIASESERVQASNQRKCYVVDHALCRAGSLRAATEAGHALENIVYLALRRRGHELRYVVTRSGFEVDFLAERQGAAPELVQVCADASDPVTRAREVRALVEAMEEREIERATIVTLADEETIVAGRMRIVVRPAWRWLLEAARG